MLDSILHDPIALVLLVLGVAIWIVAIVVIFRVEKFQPKWCWLIISCIGFFFYSIWSSSEGNAAVGVPVGSLYVLWFWRFGKSSPFDRWGRVQRQDRKS